MHTIVIDRRPRASIAAAHAVAGSLGFPSKMPGTSYGLPADACKMGGVLARIEDSVCSDCYAMRGKYNTPSVVKSHATRLAAVNHDGWVNAMVTLLVSTHARGTGKKGPIARGFHRWHDSGDVQSIEHLARICEVARRTPHIKHWLPTRESGMYRRYLAAGGTVPRNLVIRVSAAMQDGPPPKGFEHTSTVYTTGKPRNRCRASEHDDQCGPCRRCWSSRVRNVPYPKH